MNTHNLTHMEHSNHDYNAGNGISLLVGFLLAFSNSVTGWLANIQFTANWDAWIQALILGIIGSTATYFTNRFWKYVMEKKEKENRQVTIEQTNMKLNKKLIWYSLPILVGGFLIYKQLSRGKRQGEDVPTPPPTPPTPTPSLSSAFPLQKGSKNSTVGSLQSLLNTALSCSGKTLLVVDDNFGSKTETALYELTGKKSISSQADFNAVKSSLASACSKSSNLDWAWKLIEAQNTGRYNYLVVTKPVKLYKVVKDFRGLWIPAAPASALELPVKSNYSLKDYVLQSATTDGSLRMEIARAGMYMTYKTTDLKSTFNIS